MNLFITASLIGQALTIAFLLWRLVAWRRAVGRLNSGKLTRSKREPAMPVLSRLAMHRLPLHNDAPNLLPPVKFNIAAAFNARLPDNVTAEPGDRRDFVAHEAALRARLGGHREIEFLNALAISYLRRRTPHEDHARALFFRIWDECGEDLVKDMNTRWLISTLMTFADHGRTEEERSAGALGYLYGAMLVASETERAYWPEGAAPEIEATSASTERFGLNGAPPFELGTSDHLTNLHAFIYRHGRTSAVTAPIVERLMLRVRYSDTMFSRFDEARVRLQLGTRGEAGERFWSYAIRPNPDGSQF